MERVPPRRPLACWAGVNPYVHVRAQRDQAEEVAAVQRQLLDSFLFDDRAHRCVFGGQQLGGRAYLDRLRRLPNGKYEIDARRLLHLEFDVGLDHRLKSRRGDLDLIHPGSQVGKAIDARIVADRRARHVGGGVRDRYGRVYNVRAAGVFDFASNLTDGLGHPRAHREREQSNEEQESSHDHPSLRLKCNGTDYI